MVTRAPAAVELPGCVLAEAVSVSSAVAVVEAGGRPTDADVDALVEDVKVVPPPEMPRSEVL